MTWQGFAVSQQLRSQSPTARRSAPTIDNRGQSARAGIGTLCAWRAAVLPRAPVDTETAEPPPGSPWQRLVQRLGRFHPPRSDSAAIAKQRLRTVIMLDRANRYAQELLAETAPRWAHSPRPLSAVIRLDRAG